ncbi:glycosyltransferase family 2 protein [Ulvibacter litoralis]|uniref:Glycosyltransferase, GT2 family n=1 Tax=Ulvibacter litoralis TaxID=227084 RepID=A0A1G7GW72_9FLAO|nr:glycosyltransferase family 2 protein [Ulvibacter litoralis]GHC59899.1 glycosyl transferase family 2 [Ulvibacter litoralis]SDE92406.1 Glycosyltransferase, GT2 family [Ulvibacter litoralis]
MKFALIVCTYQRPKALVTLLESVALQEKYPDEVIIVDGSTNDKTTAILEESIFKNLHYFKVSEKDRGLTKQRNYGITKVSEAIEIVCFLDDDIVLTPSYFKTLLSTYALYPEAIGVGGYIINETPWRPLEENETPNISQFSWDNWVRSDGSRFVLRKKLGLDADVPPGYMPNFSHGRSVGFLPPSGKTYQVEQLMGGVASYPKRVLDSQKFSEYFEGYGLYEDADYTLRLSKKGALYLNTAAQLYHYHEASGRPNQYLYGKMVVRNGWYVWRVKHPYPSLKARLKWNATSFVLTLIRYGNVITTSKRKEAFTEALGRTAGWFSLFLNKPNIQED